MKLTDEAVLAQGERTQFRSAIYSTTGEMNNYALIMSTGENFQNEYAEFMTLESNIDVDKHGQSLVEYFNSTLRENEQPRKYERYLLLGKTSAHMFVRMPASSDQGEMFKCSGCGMICHGSAAIGSRTTPYALIPPKSTTARNKFYRNCVPRIKVPKAPKTRKLTAKDKSL